MPKIETGFYDISHLDTLAAQDTVIHRLDPRAKVLATLLFVIAVVSCDSHAVSQLLPFFFFPLLDHCTRFNNDNVEAGKG